MPEPIVDPIEEPIPDPEGKLFTQEEVNSFIAEEKRKFNKSQEEMLKGLDVEKPDELKSKIDELNQEISKYKLSELKGGVLKKLEIDSRFSEYVTGDDLESIEASATKLSELLKSSKPNITVNTEKTPAKEEQDIGDIIMEILKK